MSRNKTVVVGVDVGGRRKGFHAVALRNGRFETSNSVEPSDIAEWSEKVGAIIVAVDAPCGWSDKGKSRQAERCLAAKAIHCYATPSRKVAKTKTFYEWVLNGESLYRALKKRYTLFAGARVRGRISLEAFPHAVICALAGRIVSARKKVTERRSLLCTLGYDTGSLRACFKNPSFLLYRYCTRKPSTINELDANASNSLSDGPHR